VIFLRELALLAPSSAISSDETGFVTRFVVGALLVSHGARRDVRVTIFFDGSRCVSFEGGSMRNVRPDEQSLSGILKAGLKKIDGRGSGRVMQGINAYTKKLDDYLDDIRSMKVFYRGAGGKDVSLEEDFTAVFQHPEISREVESLLISRGFIPVRLSRGTIPPDQAVVMLNNRADRGRRY
jgi:tRNA pseudouridine-54 N-methylase